MEKKNTIFCDIDGTIFKYRLFDNLKSQEPELIESTVARLKDWYDEGHHIVLTTARPEELRNFTVMELFNKSINYHQLVMGIGRGPRYLINDMDPAKEGERAIAINLVRDQGFN